MLLHHTTQATPTDGGPNFFLRLVLVLLTYLVIVFLITSSWSCSRSTVDISTEESKLFTQIEHTYHYEQRIDSLTTLLHHQDSILSVYQCRDSLFHRDTVIVRDSTSSKTVIDTLGNRTTIIDHYHTTLHSILTYSTLATAANKYIGSTTNQLTDASTHITISDSICESDSTIHTTYVTKNKTTTSLYQYYIVLILFILSVIILLINIVYTVRKAM